MSGVDVKSEGRLVVRNSTVSTSSAFNAASASVAVSMFAARFALAAAGLPARTLASCAAVALAADARPARASARWAAALSVGSTFDALAGWSVDARSAALACGPGAAAAGIPEGVEGAVVDEAALLSAPADDAEAALEDDSPGVPASGVLFSLIPFQALCAL
jgi:hypothetical protein